MGQAAAVAAMADPQAEEAVQAMIASYDRRRRLIVDGLNSIGLTTFEPQGAFYAFPNVEISGMDEDTFAWTLLEEEKVAVVPGTAFGAAGKGHVRACYATAYGQIEQALERMQRFVRRHG
jgi:aminotransferase